MSQPEPILRDQLAEALRVTPSVLMDTSEDRARHASNPRNHHTGEHYYWGCAMCRGEVDTLVDAQAAVVQPLLDAKDTEIGRLSAALARVDEEIAEFVFAADADPNTPAACLHMIKLLRLARAEEP